MKQHYDYIIAGGGAAGLSLLLRMMNEPFFAEKQILLLDKEVKENNDRTWCFWEKAPDIFEPVVHHQWSHLRFATDDFTSRNNIAPYTYKMIRSQDLYQYVFSQIAVHLNVHVQYVNIREIQSHSDHASVITADQEFTCDQLFSSIVFQAPEKSDGQHLLLQHFKGYFIETAADEFDPTTADFMDFTANQEYGTAFFYVLPVTKRKALVEFTLFTEKLLNSGTYDEELKAHIQYKLGINDYSITETEFGIIPMTNIPFNKNTKNIVHLGTAGGWTKPSTGFTFKFIQKNTEKIISNLVSNRPVAAGIQSNKRFDFYDSVFLNVLANKRMNGKEVFERMFRKNQMQNILAFLDNETTVFEELKILKSLPTGIFMKAAADELNLY